MNFLKARGGLCNRFYSGVAIMHGLAFSIIAGTSPLVMNWLVLKWGTTAPAYYLIISAVAALAAVISTE